MDGDPCNESVVHLLLSTDWWTAWATSSWTSRGATFLEGTGLVNIDTSCDRFDGSE